eukprot:357000-Chlamydomonas_euryale.AAC.9
MRLRALAAAARSSGEHSWPRVPGTWLTWCVAAVRRCHAAVRHSRAAVRRRRAAVLPWCGAVLLCGVAMLPCSPAELPCCRAARRAEMLPCNPAELWRSPCCHSVSHCSVMLCARCSRLAACPALQHGRLHAVA